MAFLKAIQQTNTQEFVEYTTELIAYKKACSVYKRTENLLKDAAAPLQRLQYLEAKETFKTACKRYHIARVKYGNVVALQKLRAVNPELDALTFAQLTGIKIPLSLAEMLKQERQDAIARSMTDEQFETIKNAAIKNKLALESAKTQFLKSTEDKPDATLGDFEPL